MPFYQPGDIVLRDYRIEAFIGEGGFGEVYRAVDLNLREAVVIKILRTDGGMADRDYEQARARFTLEGRLGHRISHPNVVRIYKFAPDEASGLLVLVMEYISGGSLADRLSAGPLAVAEVLRIARQVAAGLSALHAQDVVHRDLKPGNILFDGAGVARVADLGLAQPASALQLSASSLGDGGRLQVSPGTPAYMSPEQANGGLHHLPPASDIYTLGLIIFEMLTGRSYKIMRPGTRVGALRPDVPAALDELVAEMLAEDPLQRPWDGAAVETALAGLCAELPGSGQTGAVHHPPAIHHLDEGLKALDEMMAAGEWQLAQETLLELEQDFPGSLRLKLPRKRIGQALAKREGATEERLADPHPEANGSGAAAARRGTGNEEAARRAAAERTRREDPQQPGHLRCLDERVFIRLDRNLEMEFIHIPAGEFLMGSDSQEDREADADEQPRHLVNLPDYWIGHSPVTNAQFGTFVRAEDYRTTAEVEGYGWIWTDRNWEHIPGADWRHPAGPDSTIEQKSNHPVVQLSWEDVSAYCKWLSRLTGQKITLPTEAEWEKAARGTTGRRFPWGDQAPDVNRCNFGMNVNDTTPVGRYSPQGDSPYGCVDMAGNVWEWCADWYDENYYPNAPRSSPTGPDTGQYRAIRGGSWDYGARFMRAAFRLWYTPAYRYDNQGFRCLLRTIS